MPFVAEQEDHSRVDITDYSVPKLQLYGRLLQCPYCHSKFHIVYKKIAFFRHRARCPDPVAQSYFSGETEEHRQAKRFLKLLCLQHLGKYTRTQPELEVRDKICNRIADLMISYQFGYRQVIEAQLCRVDVSNIQDRTESYFKAGIDVIWFLGPKCRDDRILDYLKRETGIYCFIDLEQGAFEISAENYVWRDCRLLSHRTEQMGGYLYLLEHMMRLLVLRYLRVYRYGFSPDFKLAINGTDGSENLFGSNMLSLRNHGAVESKKCQVSNQRYPVNFWTLTSPENAARRARVRHIRAMESDAVLAIRSRSVHSPRLPSDT
jgi:hypothetical protein